MSAKIFGTFFNPNSKSNSFSKQFNKKSHNLVVNFFILTIDTPTHLSNQTNLPRPPNKIFFLTNIPLKVTAPYLRCRLTKNSPTRTVHGHIFHTLYYYWITTIYGWVRLFYCLKKLPPLLTTQISLRSFASFAGG